ncbi:MAG TPA: ABC transporter permease [Bryobacteraceae bacterium]|nr:ABC transporter permease [Bryobacteraceae bacterium]
MNILLQDVLYGFRVLMKKPAFTAIAAFSLALGIGVNTAIFTLINTILLGSLPYPEPGRVVAVWTVPPQHPDQLDNVSVPDFMAWKDQNRSFETMGAMVNNVRDFGAEENGFPAERIQGEDLTPGLLQALGVQPLMGRLFQPSEDEVDHPAPVVIISYRLWQRRFNGDTNILNRTVLLNGVKNDIVGVMAPSFRLTDDDADYWAPFRFNSFQLRGSARFMIVVGRLKSGASLQQAQADMESVAGRLAKDFPARDMDHGKPWGVRVQPIREALFGFMTRPLLLLQGAVGFVLLIACANVAALLLARASSRHHEVAIRSALGAGRGRIIRQCLTESVLLSLIGGVLGVLLAWWGVRALVAMAPAWFPRLHQTVIDGRVLWFSACLSLLTGLIFGAGPAIQGSKANLVEALRDSARGGTSGAARNRLRGALVTIQLAMALVLLIGAGLLIRSFMRMQGTSLGCDPTGLLTFGVRFSPNQFGKPVATYRGIPLWELSSVPSDTLNRIFERVQSVPGVQSAAGTLFPPLTGALTLPFTIEGRTVQDTDALSAEFSPITPNYFNTMKTPILRGRDFNARDTLSTPWVAIINETMAHRFWPNEDPIGKRVKLDLAPEEQPREVIAIVHDTPSSRLQTKQNAALYVPFVQMPLHLQGPFNGLRMQMTFVLRTVGEPMSLMPSMRRAVAGIDPNRPLVDPKTVERHMAEQVQYPRYYSMLLGLFAGVALTLAAVGIYGVMAYAVAQRTREIGIRMALGAGGWDVLRLVVRQALLLIVGGLALGLAGATALTRFISSELWEVTPTDPVTFGAVSMLLLSVALIACLVPTLRAVRVDPTVALRYE